MTDKKQDECANYDFIDCPKRCVMSPTCPLYKPAPKEPMTMMCPKCGRENLDRTGDADEWYCPDCKGFWIISFDPDKVTL